MLAEEENLNQATINIRPLNKEHGGLVLFVSAVQSHCVTSDRCDRPLHEKVG